MSSGYIGSPSGNVIVPVNATMSPELAGTIVSYAGSTASFDTASTDGTTLYYKNGWAVCNGASLSQGTYAALYARIAATWNTSRNQGTGSNYSSPTSGYFRLPDLRGVFLRGDGTSTGYAATTLAATQEDATAKNGLAASSVSSSVSGSVGGSDGTHTHGDNGHTHTIGITGTYQHSGGFGGHDGTGGSTGTGYASINTTGSGHGHSFSLTAAAQTITVGAGDSETRPVNVGVIYLIRLYDAPTAGVSVYIPSASATSAGLVDTAAAQTFAGVKTFSSAPLITGATVAKAAGYVGENITSGSQLTQTVPSGSWGTIASITLTAGIWDISALAVFVGAASLTKVTMGIATGTNGSTGHVSGDNQASVPLGATLDASISIPAWRTVLTGNQAYYLTALGSGAATTANCRISATRVG